MRTKACLLAAVLALSGSLAAQSQPQNEGDPLDLKTYDCAAHLELADLEDGRSDIATVWAHGYYNGMRGVDEKSGPASWLPIDTFSERLLKMCDADPKMLFIGAVKKIAQAGPAASR